MSATSTSTMPPTLLPDLDEAPAEPELPNPEPELPTAPIDDPGGAPPSGLLEIQEIIEENFPGLWPAVDLGLSTAATLLLKDNANPVAVIYVGGPSSSKTTVATFFMGHRLCYHSDNFTPAAFVSHAANVSRKKLADVDLLPRIKHKVLVTPELAPIFRGKEEDLIKPFALLTRVLDGQGLHTDSGTHGGRGYAGDYLFAWLGCTTPLDPKVWRVMAQLGSRLFFLVMEPEGEVTVEELVASVHGPSYVERLAKCQAAVHTLLTDLLRAGVRSVRWDATQDPPEVSVWLARFAKVLAAMRSDPQREPELNSGSGALIPAKEEQPWRAHAVLRNLARGHALVHGRTHLSADDLPLVARVTVSSMPTECARVFEAAVKKGQPLKVADAQAALGVRSPETARQAMADLDRRGVMEYVQEGPGKAAVLRFRPEWDWCASPEFRALLLGEGQPVKNRGVCVACHS